MQDFKHLKSLPELVKASPEAACPDAPLSVSPLTLSPMPGSRAKEEPPKSVFASAENSPPSSRQGPLRYSPATASYSTHADVSCSPAQCLIIVLQGKICGLAVVAVAQHRVSGTAEI